jgi:hypothetical protein
MAKYSNIATITIGNTESNIISANERAATGFIVSGSTTTGSLVSFLVSNDGTNFYPLYDSSSTEVSIIVSTTPKAYSLNPEVFMGWNFIKIRLGTSASAKAQATYDARVELVTDSM